MDKQMDQEVQELEGMLETAPEICFWWLFRVINLAWPNRKSTRQIMLSLAASYMIEMMYTVLEKSKSIMVTHKAMNLLLESHFKTLPTSPHSSWKWAFMKITVYSLTHTTFRSGKHVLRLGKSIWTFFFTIQQFISNDFSNYFVERLSSMEQNLLVTLINLFLGWLIQMIVMLYFLKSAKLKELIQVVHSLNIPSAAGADHLDRNILRFSDEVLATDGVKSVQKPYQKPSTKLGKYLLTASC